MIKPILWSIAFAWVCPQFALAATGDFALGTPVLSGSGCPAGTASSTLSPDHHALSVLFDQYSIQVGGSTGKSVLTKTCRIIVPIQLPAGTSMTLLHSDYRGFNNLPLGGASKFMSYIGFIPVGGQIANTRGSYANQRFDGAKSGDFEVTSDLNTGVTSQCGGLVNLVIYTRLAAKTDFSHAVTSANIDSFDLTSTGTGPTYAVGPCQ